MITNYICAAVQPIEYEILISIKQMGRTVNAIQKKICRLSLNIVILQ